MKASSRIINILIWLSVLTSSFDIFLTFEIAGFTIRISQILMAFVILFYILQFLTGRARIFSPVGFGWLIVCILLNTLFCFNSKSMTNALAYDLWFMFDAMQILVVVYYLRQSETAESLTQKYLCCFFIMSVIGLLQVVLQYVGVNFFVTQQNEMHRANGFSYEPSYYATYLLLGWCMCMYLAEKGNRNVFSRKILIVFAVVISLALILSTSRMGWLMMILYVISRIAVNFRRLFVVKLNVWKILLILAIIGVAVYFIFGIATGNESVLKYLNGLGIAGTASHSTSDRIQRFINTLRVFLNSPIIGVSLGGVDPAIYYDILGESTFSNGIAISVFAEMLAAVGIVGFVCWLIYLYNLMFSYRKMKFESEADKQLIVAYVIALAFVFIILQLNQNILRPMLWLHIALLSALYYTGKKPKQMLPGNFSAQTK